MTEGMPNPPLPRLQALVTHRLTPPHPSFDTALNNARQLRELFEATGSAQDEQRMQDARRMYFDMHVSHATDNVVVAANARTKPLQ